MATQVQSLFGLTPDVLQSQRNAALNDQAFQFAQMTPMQQAQMGLFRGGSQLGTGLAGLMGYQDPEEMRLKDINDIGSKIQWDKPESIMQAAQEMSTKGYSREAMALMQKAQEAQKEQQALKLQQAQTGYWERRGTGTDGGTGGTGPERMSAFIASVQSRMEAGEEVPREEVLRAQLFAETLSKNQFFKMADGSVVSVPKNDLGRIAEVLRNGGEAIQTSVGGSSPASQSQGQPTQAATPSVSGGAKVIQTPESIATAEKTAQAGQVNQAVFESDLNQIRKAKDLLRKEGRWAAGVGSLLSFMPESAANSMQALISSIAAGKLINQIQSMKSVSPTGSTGFGSLTEKEGQFLIDRLGALRQTKDPKELLKDLEEIETLMTKMFQATTPTQPQAAPTAPPKQGSTDRAAKDKALVDRIMADPRVRGTRAQIEAKLRREGKIQ
jgi:hypothetical protein